MPKSSLIWLIEVKAMPKSSLIWPKSSLIWLIQVLFGSSKSYLAEIQPYFKGQEAAPVVEQRIDLGHDHKSSGTFGELVEITRPVAPLGSSLRSQVQWHLWGAR
jgi:hypothetical protein